jgi:hypothetical protein
MLRSDCSESMKASAVPPTTATNWTLSGQATELEGGPLQCRAYFVHVGAVERDPLLPAHRHSIGLRALQDLIHVARMPPSNLVGRSAVFYVTRRCQKYTDELSSHCFNNGQPKGHLRI